MKHSATYIAENEQEIEDILHKAKKAKEEGSSLPFKIEGSMPLENMDELIRSCHAALASGLKTASFTITE